MRSISRLKRLGIVGISLGMLASPLGFALDGDDATQESQQGSNTGTTEYQEPQGTAQGQDGYGSGGGSSSADPQGYDQPEDGASSGQMAEEGETTWEEEESQQSEGGW